MGQSCSYFIQGNEQQWNAQRNTVAHLKNADDEKIHGSDADFSLIHSGGKQTFWQ